MPEFDHERFLAHWFGDTRENPTTIADRSPWWFAPDAERDAWLEQHYLRPCLGAMGGQYETLGETAPGRLALILLLDQLPRNLFRGTAKAFESDGAALRLCLEGNESGQDMDLTPVERVFFWMPLQHVENLELQNLGVDLFSSLAPEDPAHAEHWDNFASFAKLHRDIIAEFGRFPHRNAVLGRSSTKAEREYLASGGHSFGQ